MKMDQRQDTQPILIKFYFFLRNRDAKIVELFFLALNVYILALIVLPPYSYTGLSLYARELVQAAITGLNLAALIQYHNKMVRIISAIANAAIMTLIAMQLFSMNNPNSGTYALLALLAAFVCWKINIR